MNYFHARASLVNQPQTVGLDVCAYIRKGLVSCVLVGAQRLENRPVCEPQTLVTNNSLLVERAVRAA